MKKLLSTALFICATILCTANDYEPTEGWPYLYEDFKPAIVYYQDGKAESADINVHLASNILHFTDNDKIMVVDNATRIDSVVCEDNTKLVRRGNLYVELKAHSQYILIGTTCECDFNALGESNGAYGTPTTVAATQNVASFKDHGNMAALRYKEMIADRHNTSTLPTIKRTVMVVNDRAICQATKRGVNELLTKEQRKEFNSFLKTNKIKWKDINSLLLVAEYLDKLVEADTLIL